METARRCAARRCSRSPPRPDSRRARRDILAAREAGRFVVGDPEVALACVGGALLGVLDLGVTSSATPDALDRAADQLALYLLSMFDVPRDDAERICARHLSTVSGWAGSR
ncbi:hypothetical protein ABLG96_15440 [Nakamurella sp. A5-74]|uniref:Tetracyclin repressor-like 40 C-terminal domain-containing protein n=1 Tax=Nakamurella sp. A5-74 TaxID=3158264 RepID=A0AAU8DM77_9ACTN